VITVDEWRGALTPGQRVQADWLVATVREAIPRAGAAVKRGRLTFALAGDWEDWLCAIVATKTSVKLVFHKGTLLDDPAGLLRGTDPYLRHLTYVTATALPEATIAMLRSAVEYCTDLRP